MKILINSIDATQERKFLGTIMGHYSEIDEYLYEFNKNNVFQIEEDRIEIAASIAKNNFKGWLAITKNNSAFLETLVTVDEVFLLSVMVSEKNWVEIIVDSGKEI
jgi:hypothetical protein